MKYRGWSSASDIAISFELLRDGYQWENPIRNQIGLCNSLRSYVGVHITNNIAKLQPTRTAAANVLYFVPYLVSSCVS